MHNEQFNLENADFIRFFVFALFSCTIYVLLLFAQAMSRSRARHVLGKLGKLGGPAIIYTFAKG